MNSLQILLYLAWSILFHSSIWRSLNSILTQLNLNSNYWAWHYSAQLVSNIHLYTFDMTCINILFCRKWMCTWTSVCWGTSGQWYYLLTMTTPSYSAAERHSLTITGTFFFVNFIHFCHFYSAIFLPSHFRSLGPKRLHLTRNDFHLNYFYPLSV